MIHIQLLFFRFHSTKEGFKVDLHVVLLRSSQVSIPLRKVSRGGEWKRWILRSSVSIPLRKVSRVPPALAGAIALQGFHSTKEGFKGEYQDPKVFSGVCFHSTKEGFKVPFVT